MMRELLVTVCVVLLFVGSLIAQGKGKKGEAVTAAYGIAVVMDQDANGDGLPNYGDYIHFDVGSAIENPFIELRCYQGTTWVLASAWPADWSVIMAADPWWTSGAGECTARLYTTEDGTSTTTLATITFPVGA